MIDCYRSASSPTLRSVPPFRAEGDSEATPILHGHFGVTNQWTEINSAFEGRFMERIAPGAFVKSIARDRGNIKVLFQHGRDPQLADRILGSIQVLREDARGGAYEVGLFRGLDPLLMEGLRANKYGASFRFQVVREDMDDTARASSYNPLGLPERTIREATVMEFGPVTFPAYEGATAGVRSLTDWFLNAASS